MKSRSAGYEIFLLFEESLYSEESLSITIYIVAVFFFVFCFFSRHDQAGAHIKQDLLK